MATYEQPTLAGFEDELRFYPQESRVSQAPLPGSEEALKMTVGSGRQCSMLLEESNPLGAFSRILLESCLWTSSEEYCYVWDRLDTRFALSAFRLTPLELNTDGNGCSLLLQTPNTFDSLAPKSQEALDHEKEMGLRTGRDRRTPNNLRDQIAVRAGIRLWRTPNASDVTGAAMNGERRLEQGHHLNLLEQAATPKLWPTPTVPNGGRRNPEGTSITGRKPDGGKAQIDIREFAIRLYDSKGQPNGEIKYKLLPTPQAHDAAKGNPARVNRFGTEHGGRNLNDEMADSTSGSLNPRFVEELMGFPIDHTACAPSATPLSRSRPTRSSRRSPKSLLIRPGVAVEIGELE